ncbi:hypothetical protein [Jiangella alba]|uniref:Uncharacterized protein n=1 Tax=Jiangella alba TaxID=561176 RepID=A0A1H5PU51_9ACTN|nr:hypothetical protein [Jiangella alba]SEF17316.1 hypothetical protein SAMN04488561_5806 [Jiangella alba]
MAEDRTDPDSGERDSWFGRHQQAAWIGVLGSVLVALIALVPQILEYLDDDEPAGGAEPVAAPPPTSAEQPDVTSPPPSTDPTTPAAGQEHWQGRLLVDTGGKDLDAAQPVDVGYGDEGDVYMISATVIEGGNGAVVSAWPGGAADPPGYQECAGTVDAEGTDQQELADDSVLCVRTNGGNIARLVVTERGSGTDYGTTFDAVVWAES